MLYMNEIKLVHGAARNRKFITPGKQAEMKQLQDKQTQDRKEQFISEWFTVDESAEVSLSDKVMTIGTFVVVPFLVVATALGAILV